MSIHPLTNPITPSTISGTGPVFRAEDLDPVVIREQALELWKGQLRRKCFGGSLYNLASIRLLSLLIDQVIRDESLGFCGDTETFLLGRNPDILLSPFAALFQQRQQNGTAWHSFAPEVAIEYVSEFIPRGIANEKKAAWLAAGTREVWFLQEETRSVEIYRQGHTLERHQDTTFKATGIAQGLVIDTAALFSLELGT
jgi:hypothetical protein